MGMQHKKELFFSDAPVVAAVHRVINRARKLQAKLSRHAGTPPLPSRPVNPQCGNARNRPLHRYAHTPAAVNGKSANSEGLTLALAQRSVTQEKKSSCKDLKDRLLNLIEPDAHQSSFMGQRADSLLLLQRPHRLFRVRTSSSAPESGRNLLILEKCIIGATFQLEP